MYLDTEELAIYAEALIAQLDGVRSVSRLIGPDNSGNITHARNGNDSPACRRSWKIPKHPQRNRAIINLSPAQLERWQTIVTDSGKPAGDCLVDLMDLGDGIGEIV